MKLSNSLNRVAGCATIVLWMAGGVLAADLRAADPKEAPPKPTVAQLVFASPEEAVSALQAAKDKAAFLEIFGAQYQEIMTGDAVLDTNNTQRFAAALAQGCLPVKSGEDKVIMEIGTNNWPMAIPLVKAEGKWFFDTAAGKEEVINRHIGKDELHAIGVCRAYVVAQRQYASLTASAGGGTKYAQQYKSSPGKRDGLYWPTAENEPASPFGALLADAHAEGYASQKPGTGPHPFHGYLFRILTKQGKAAPGGKMDYMSHGDLTGGFALVAYPLSWDQSGIMTFIVNQDGKIYQRNLGDKTARIAGSMKEYNPDSDWKLVQDAGVANAGAER